MWFLIGMIALIVIGVLSVLYITYFRLIIFGITLIIGFSIATINLIKLLGEITNKKEPKKISWQKIISIILYILYVTIGIRYYELLRTYGEVTKYYNQNHEKYKIVKIHKMKDNSIEGNYYCDYVYDIKYQDDTDITIKSGLCGMDGSIIDKVVDNYWSKYLPYYFEKYKKENHKTTLELKDNKWNTFYGKDLIVQVDDENDLKDFCQFASFLQTKTKRVEILYYNTKEENYSSHIFINNESYHMECDKY